MRPWSSCQASTTACNRSTFSSVSWRFSLALGFSVPEFRFPYGLGSSGLWPPGGGLPVLQASAFGWPLPHRPGPPPSAACPLPTSAPEHAQPSLKSRSSRTLHRRVSGYRRHQPRPARVFHARAMRQRRQRPAPDRAGPGRGVRRRRTAAFPQPTTAARHRERGARAPLAARISAARWATARASASRIRTSCSKI